MRFRFSTSYPIDVSSSVLSFVPSPSYVKEGRPRRFPSSRARGFLSSSSASAQLPTDSCLQSPEVTFLVSDGWKSPVHPHIYQNGHSSSFSLFSLGSTLTMHVSLRFDSRFVTSISARCAAYLFAWLGSGWSPVLNVAAICLSVAPSSCSRLLSQFVGADPRLTEQCRACSRRVRRRSCRRTTIGAFLR